MSIFFPVTEQLITTEVMETPVGKLRIKAPAHKAIVRTDTYEVLGVHSAAYKLVTNEEVFGKLDDALLSSGLDLIGRTDDDILDFNGARTVRTITLPEHKVKVNGDDISLQVRTTNSYDGSLRFDMILGGIRWACTNGMVSGDLLSRTRHKHTRGLDLDAIIAQLKMAANSFQDNQYTWQRWAQKSVSSAQMLTLVEGMTTSRKAQDELMTLFYRYSHEMGYTAWTAYNAITDWSSHTKGQKATRQGTALLEREAKVRSVLPELDKIAA